ncbi:MAG: 5-oxoprolinase subunit PxpA [Thermodesulfobacteriota bacterium]
MDLNCDMGESFGAYRLGFDQRVIQHITSANIACGWHAGDPNIMDETVKLAVQHHVGIGAHPGYPDLLGFGRRNMDCTAEEIRRYMIYQIGALSAFCRVHGTRLQHVKPHGALYLTAVENEMVARAVAEAIVSVDSSLFYIALAGAKGKMMRHIGEEVGLKVIYEAFPDRAYTSEGTLLSRRKPGAVIKDPEEVAERALMMAADGVVVAVDGTRIPLEAQTLCVHGDTPTAVELVERIRKALESKRIRLMPMGLSTDPKGETVGSRSF